ncbi:hypothetical protein C8R41DRAFT_865823 [Lentinula lateritia]|uniref:Epidermal growth factor receptor-like transmembrane-juxtamembrane segment domain-containing protein n=1 Tax=Lentinula lateritia TaxID=40482 RepID=A0ABQ8VQR4_9AGAR|nr:hypothetical protein C8R41DRAFT_865823 [Lentinula lateritia]
MLSLLAGVFSRAFGVALCVSTMPALAARSSTFADTYVVPASKVSSAIVLMTSTALITPQILSGESTSTYLAKERYHVATSNRSPIPEATSTSKYGIHQSTNDRWGNARRTFDRCQSTICVKSQGSGDVSYTKVNIDATVTATPVRAVVPLFTLAANISTNNITTTGTSASASTAVTTKKHSERNIVSRAVGGAVGGVMFLLILALLTFLLFRRNRQRRRSPSQQYLRSVPITSRAVSQDRDMKDPSSRTASPSTYTSTRTATYSKSFVRPWTADLESGSTFKDDSSVTTQSISAPFIPPAPRTTVPEAPPPLERLTSDLRDRPSRFVEQLMVNSTDLGVLLAIAKGAWNRDIIDIL